MRIEKVVLSNFRGIAHFEVSMNGGNTDIYGSNGAGKTTLANAICWLLCNCPITGEKEFDPKTAGIHQKKHGAEIQLLMHDDTPIRFGKYYFEVWKKKRGGEYVLDGHKTEYFINGTSCSKKTYEATVESATKCNSQNLRLLMVLGFFMTLSQETRRNILFELIPEVSDEEVLHGCDELDGFTDILKVFGSEQDSQKTLYYTPNEYKETVIVRKKNLQKELEYFPIRISEIGKLLPNMRTESTDDIQEEIEIYQEHIKNCQKLITEMDNPKEIAVLKAQIETLNKERLERIESMSQDIIAMNNKKQQMVDEKMEQGLKTTETINALNCEILKLEVEIQKLEEMRNKLLDAYKIEYDVTWSKENEICPTCGQAIPADKVKELQIEFKKNKQLKLAQINKEGQSCSKKMIDDLKKNIEKKKKEVLDGKTKCTALHNDILALKHSMGALTDFDATDEGITLAGTIKRHMAEIEQFSHDAKQVKETLQEQIAEWNEKIKDAYQRMGIISNAEENLKRIEELKKKQREYGAQLEQIERGLEMCKIFTFRKAKMITDKINQKFSYVQFTLFKERLNGNLQEVCEPMLKNTAGQLVEYKSANTAAQVNACMEIIDKLNEHYGTNLPILMDRAESVTTPIKVKEQLIRFIVSSDYDKLTAVENQ